MKLVIATVVVLLVGASIFADYKWRRWIAARKVERQDRQ
jgi:hypothetical protein